MMMIMIGRVTIRLHGYYYLIALRAVHLSLVAKKNWRE